MPTLLEPRPDDGVPLWRRLRAQPRVADLDGVRLRCADFVAAAKPPLRDLLEDPRVDRLVAGIADHSPHLWRLIAADPARFSDVLTADPTARLAHILADLRALPLKAGGDIARRLRLAKQDVLLMVALADLGGVWPLETVMLALSEAADVLVATALCHVLHATCRTGALKLAHPDTPELACGLVVLATGKLGGRELGYAGDIDLVGLFDPDAPCVPASGNAAAVFCRVMQDVVDLLQQVTADGHVYRIDLRSRPGTTVADAAIGIPAALLHYEGLGQNRDRATMVKARPIAGDLGLGANFLNDLSPFVWRRYFDFAAIADIHAMKRDLHAADGGGEIAVAHHNVAFGRGGVREIEMFVQAQQLIFGGKRPQLRGTRTLPSLRQLRRDNRIDAETVKDLTRAYTFLRRTENRLQMVANEHLHRLPGQPDPLRRFALFCNYPSSVQFGEVLTHHLQRVAFHYALLFDPSSQDDDDPGGGLVFDPGTDATGPEAALAALGYRTPAAIVQRVRHWLAGRRGGLRSDSVRARLTPLVPKLLATLARTADPDAAVAYLDASLDHMPAAGELFAILAAKKPLLALFGDLVGSAPRLAAAVMRRPHLLDVALDPTPDSLRGDAMERRIAAAVTRTRTTEEHLDAVRDAQQEEHFRIGVRLVSGDIALDEASAAYTALAVGVIRAVLRQVEGMFATEHGRVPGGALAVLAMGHLGSREMTATSDLDFIVLYDFDPTQPESDGSRPLHATRYYTRLTQRLVSHLTIETRRGGLYACDMRPRPSGRQGPLATKLAAFVPYQRDKAELWDRLAMTRARIVAGDEPFGARVSDVIAATRRRRSKVGRAQDLADMRVAFAHQSTSPADGDRTPPGGLIHLERLAEGLILSHAVKTVGGTGPFTTDVLRRAALTGRLDGGTSDDLIAAYDLLAGLRQFGQTTTGLEPDPLNAPSSLLSRMAAKANRTDTIAEMRDHVAAACRTVADAVHMFLAPS